ncbi:MAG: aminoacyl-tRNA hydrolase [Nitriliruptoraceae bacterium]
MAPERWLAVGLGNPEPEYAGTRHNIGADVVRALAKREGVTMSRNKRARGAVAEVDVDGTPLVLFVAEAFMNTSGDPVRAAANWYKVPLDRLIVCHDDLDLPLGAVRCKRGGGNGGHNGLADVQRAFGSPDYLRVRIGIGRPPGRIPGRDHVLGRFTADERDAADVAVDQAGAAVVSLVADGLDVTQNTFHARDVSPGAGA